jgi:hypothetical protein
MAGYNDISVLSVKAVCMWRAYRVHADHLANVLDVVIDSATKRVDR